MANKRILLIEDDKDSVLAMAVRLKGQGYDLAVAHDAVSAVATARKEKPDLIVLDLGLPGGRRICGDAAAQIQRGPDARPDHRCKRPRSSHE